MKFKTIIIAMLTYALFSCATTGGENNYSIRDAVKLTADEITGNLPANSRVVIVLIRSSNEQFSEYMAEELAFQLFQRKLEVADRQNLDHVMNELNFQMSGLVSDESALSIGKFVGAQYVITGQLRETGNINTLIINAINVEGATRSSISRFDIKNNSSLAKMSSGSVPKKPKIEKPKGEPKTAGAFCDRGILFSSRGEYEMAIADFNEAIRINPNFWSAYHNRGWAYFNIDADLALEDFTQAIRLDPNNTWSYHGRGAAYVHRKRDANRGIDDLNIAIRLNPNNSHAYFDRGCAYLYLREDYDRAIEDFTRSINIKDDFANVYTDRAEAYRFKKDYVRALEDINKSIQLDPNNIWSFIRRGSIYKDQKNYDRAMEDFNQAIRLDGNFADGYANRANTYREMKNYNRALEDFNKAIQLNPNVSWVYSARGDLYNFDMKNYDPAIENYNIAIRLDPNNKFSYAGRGNAYLSKRDYDRAIADFETAQRLGNNEQWIRDNLNTARRRGR